MATVEVFRRPNATKRFLHFQVFYHNHLGQIESLCDERGTPCEYGIADHRAEGTSPQDAQKLYARRMAEAKHVCAMVSKGELIPYEGRPKTRQPNQPTVTRMPNEGGGAQTGRWTYTTPPWEEREPQRESFAEMKRDPTAWLRWMVAQQINRKKE